MLRKRIAQPTTVIILLVIQIIPLLLFPADTYSPTSQQWWLPVILSVLVLVAILKLVFQPTPDLWPWHLISFSQGISIISRLMMLMPHATYNLNGTQVANIPYIITNVVSIFLSAGYIYYSELPDVRMSLLPQKQAG
jgi:cyanate permease